MIILYNNTVTDTCSSERRHATEILEAADTTATCGGSSKLYIFAEDADMIHEGKDANSTNSYNPEIYITYLAVATTELDQEYQEYYPPEDDAEQCLPEKLNKIRQSYDISFSTVECYFISS